MGVRASAPLPPAPAWWCLDLCPPGPQVEAEEPPQDVVVYDQSTRDASVLAADSFLSVLLSKLDGCFDSVAILTGEPGGWGVPPPLRSASLPHGLLGWESGTPGVGVLGLPRSL